MRREIVEATNEQEALERCPWSCQVVPVDSSEADRYRYLCFESAADADIWSNQK